MSKHPLISIVIPIRHLSYYLLFESLPEFSKQSYTNYEIIVLPNEHSNYDITLLKQYKKLRIIPTGKVTRPAQKRDLGVRSAKGQIIAFIDDDAYPAPNWLEETVKIFNKRKVLTVCGPGILPKSASFWEKVFDEVLKSWIGSGSYNYRFTPKTKRYVTDFPSMNFFVLKQTFLDLGGFNSNYWPGEDSKLCNDLIKMSKKAIYYSPDVLVFHHRRTSLRDYLTQHGRYGFHRGAFFAHRDRNSMEISYVVPTFFLTYLLLLPILITASYVLRALTPQILLIMFTPLIIYAILVSFLLLQSFFNTFNFIVSLSSAVILAMTHVIYGFQFIRGFKKGKNNNHNIYE